MPRSWLEKRVSPRTGILSYRLRYTSPDGTIHSETVRATPGEDPRTTKARARIRLAELTTDIHRGDWRPPARLTLFDAIDAWLEVRSPKLAPATVNRHARAIARIPPWLGDLPIDEVTPSILQTWYITCSRAGVAREGIRALHKPIRAALAHQTRLGAIRANPALGVEIPGADPPPRPIWTAAQVARFLAAVDDDTRYGALYRLAFTLGLRRGELLALRPCDVNLLSGVLSVRRTLSEDEAGRLWIREHPKTSSSVRDLAVPPVCVAALQRHPMGCELVFHRDEAIIRPRTLARHFGRTAKALGLPHMRLHDCRHCAATALKALGVHPWLVADILGHRSVAMSRSYAHGTPDSQRAALAALAAAYERPTQGLP